MHNCGGMIEHPEIVLRSRLPNTLLNLTGTVAQSLACSPATPTVPGLILNKCGIFSYVSSTILSLTYKLRHNLLADKQPVFSIVFGFNSLNFGYVSLKLRQLFHRNMDILIFGCHKSMTQHDTFSKETFKYFLQIDEINQTFHTTFNTLHPEYL